VFIATIRVQSLCSTYLVCKDVLCTLPNPKCVRSDHPAAGASSGAAMNPFISACMKACTGASVGAQVVYFPRASIRASTGAPIDVL